MDATLLLFLLAALFFVFEAFQFAIGTLSPKWWALGVAAYLVAQVV